MKKIRMMSLFLFSAGIGFASENGQKANNAFDTILSLDAKIIQEWLNLLDPSHREEANHRMQPSLFSALPLANEADGLAIRSTMTHRLDEIHRGSLCDCQCGSVDHLWAEGLASLSHQHKEDGEFGFHTSTAGVVAGLDHLFCGDTVLGLSGAYTSDSLHWSQGSGKGTLQSGYLGLYGTLFDDCTYLDLALWGAYNDYRVHRNIEFQGVDRKASNRHHGETAGGYLGIGALMPICEYVLRPFGALDYLFVHETGYTEEGAGSLDLDVEAKNANLWRSELGFHFFRGLSLSTCAYCGICDYLFPEVILSWVHEEHVHGDNTLTRFVDSDVEFTVEGLKPFRDLLCPSVAFTALLNNNDYSITLRYDGEIGRHYWNHEISLMVGLSY